MTITEVVSVIYALSALGGAVSLGWGLNRIASSLQRPSAPTQGPGPMSAPPVRQEDVDRFVESIRKARQKQEDAFAMRGGSPDPHRTRPGRHVNVPE